MVTEICNQFVKDGKLTLSQGSIQLILSNGSLENPAILQVLNYRSTDGKVGGRVKLSDGAFEYSGGIFDLSLIDKLKEDFDSDPITPDNCPIIVAYQMDLRDVNLSSGKVPIAIKSYDVLMKNVPKLGTPIKHSGDPENHRGFEKCAFNKVFVSVEKKEDIKDTPIPSSIQTKQPQSTINKGGMAARGPPQPSKQSSTGSSIQHFNPISAISPYLSKWRIRGVVSSKEDLRTVKMKTGETKVFNFELTDEDGKTCIRIAAFGECAERYYGLIQENTMYAISSASVRPANKRFNNTGHDYELSLNSSSEVGPLKESACIKVSFHIKPIKLNEVVKKNGELVDILACIDNVEEANNFNSRDGRPFVKREVSLIDETGTVVNFVLWGDQAKNFPQDATGQVLGIKGAAVKEFNGGITLGSGNGCKFVLTPEVDGVCELLEWHQNERCNVQAQSLSSASNEGALNRDLRLLGTSAALQLGRGDPVYMNVKARISNIKTENALYQACAQENCQKKVIAVDDEYRCEKCGITSNQFKFAYMIQMEILDMTGSIWITVFSKTAEQLLEISAEELGEMKNNNPVAYDTYFKNIMFSTRMFRIRARSEVYNDEERIKYSAFSIDKPDYTKLNTAFDGVITRLNNLTV